jgi:hypothetical protein
MELDRHGLAICVAALSAICAGCGPSGSGERLSSAPFDVLITGARVVDGAGNPWFRADVGIRE